MKCLDDRNRRTGEYSEANAPCSAWYCFWSVDADDVVAVGPACRETCGIDTIRCEMQR